MFAIGACPTLGVTKLSFWLLWLSMASLELLDRASLFYEIEYAVSSNSRA